MAANSSTSDAPRTTSGTRMGKARKASQPARPRPARRSPMAAAVPIAVEIAVVASATARLFRSEACMRSSARACAYHASVNPSQDEASRPELNEKTTSTSSGA